KLGEAVAPAAGALLGILRNLLLGLERTNPFLRGVEDGVSDFVCPDQRYGLGQLRSEGESQCGLDEVEATQGFTVCSHHEFFPAVWFDLLPAVFLAVWLRMARTTAGL